MQIKLKTRLTKSTLSVVIIVAEHIHDHKAVLLHQSQISQTFLEIHGISPTAYLEVCETTNNNQIYIKVANSSATTLPTPIHDVQMCTP